MIDKTEFNIIYRRGYQYDIAKFLSYKRSFIVCSKVKYKKKEFINIYCKQQVDSNPRIEKKYYLKISYLVNYFICFADKFN